MRLKSELILVLFNFFFNLVIFYVLKKRGDFIGGDFFLFYFNYKLKGLGLLLNTEIGKKNIHSTFFWPKGQIIFSQSPPQELEERLKLGKTLNLPLFGVCV